MHTHRDGAPQIIAILVNSMGKIWKFNSLAEEMRYQPRTLPRTSPVACSSENVSLHHHHCSFIPCGAHLAGLSFVLAYRRLTTSPLSYFIYLFLSLSSSLRQSIQAKSSCSEQRCLVMKNPGEMFRELLSFC